MRRFFLIPGFLLLLTGCSNNSASAPEKETTTIQNTPIPSADTPAAKSVTAPEKTVAGWQGVQEITEANFTQKVLSNPGLTVVDFNATWCGPCKTLKPLFKKAADNFAGKASFASIDVDQNPTVSQQYQVQSIPLLLFFKDGKIVNKSIGLLGAAALNKAIESFL
jgi:thioredoxin 1